jgi:hypothetical protein
MVRGNAMRQAAEPHVSHAQNIGRCKRHRAFYGARLLENFYPAHDPEKCAAVFRKDHAQTRI